MNDAHAPRCACLTMQKNEMTLLEPWVRYHSALFGAENLFVFDNGSTHPEVIETLGRIEKQGVTVDRRFDDKEHFANKGKVLGERMAVLRDTNDYDWLIAIDCDEFFALEEGDTVTFEPAKILAYLAALADETRLPQVTANYLNVLGSSDKFLKQPYEKVFFQARGFVEVDHGFHTGTSSLSADRVHSNIVYIHCHAKPFAIQVDHSREKLMSYCDVDDPESLAALEISGGIGWHLVKYLQMTEAEYLNLFKAEDAVSLPGFSEQLQKIGAKNNFLLGLLPEPEETMTFMKLPICPGIWSSAGRLGPRTSNSILVMGAPSHGLAAILQALASVGVAVDSSADLYLDKRWLSARMNVDAEARKRWLLIRAAQPGVWATWLPDTLAIDDEVVAALRAPRVIFVQEGPVNGGAVVGLDRAYRERAAQIEQLLDFGVPLLLIDPLAVSSNIFGIAEILLHFSAIPYSSENIWKMIEKLKVLGQSSGFEGYIDYVKRDVLTGWCWQLGSRQRLTVELYVDGVKRAAACADRLRPDLERAGKGDGRCSFALTIGDLRLSESSVIEMMVAGSSYRLGHSGMSLSELRQRGE